MDFKIEDSISEFIKLKVKEKNLILSNMTVTGFSKGGSAALYYGLKLNISNILVTVPQIYIGSYINKNWHRTALHMMGADYSSVDIQFINNLLPRLLKSDTELEKNIYLITSEADNQYKEHLEPNLNDLMKYKNFNLIKSYSLFVREHNQVTSHHTSLVLSILYALASDAIPRFNDGNVNFFGSQPIKKSKASLNPIIDLKIINIQNDKLFIEGVGIVEGVDVEDYQDINYELIFKGKSNFIKKLAKAHRPNLTRGYFKKEIVIYDKCWFSTYQHLGLDVSDLTEGSYELYIKIKVKGSEVITKMTSSVKIEYSDNNFSFNSDFKGNVFIVKRK
ncbi:hypothetical protein HQR03_06545 [Psychrobacter okhotskensis]|uniref:hypothetical protein n=1 Tax=Psychrobacter okhotskensis TaxID=212403 RepID=UPI00156458A7|nr:hypothetical protein [Psychrobacter okhotskensis]NRD70193.1 hypothetical protein [Psychrobacter okhotskensis]